jgi:hypothetical protein
MSAHDRREGSNPSERDAALERLWRETSVEQPPAHLDAALLAAARESVASRRPQSEEPARLSRRRARTSPWLARWQPLAAAAAVAGLAFVLVPTMMSREEKLAPTLQRPASTSVPAAAESQLDGPPAPDAIDAIDAIDATEARATPVPAREPDGRREHDVGTADRPLVQREVPAPPASAAVPPPLASTEAAAADTTAPMAKTPEVTFGERSDARSKALEAETAGRAAASAPAAAAEPSPATRDRNADDAMVLDAAAWAARIEALHASGDVAAAERELRAFRAADPTADAYLSNPLRDWARTVE